MKTLWLHILICSLMGIMSIAGDLGGDSITGNLLPKEKVDTPDVDANVRLVHHSGTTEERGRLINRLFSDYDKRNYPTNSTLKLGLTMMSVDIDEERSTMNSQAWLYMLWQDPRLSWDKNEYDVGVLRLPVDEVWKPDVTLYNSADHPGTKNCGSSFAVIYSNGKVVWIPPCQLRGFCDTDPLSKEPYAPLTCSFVFGSWTFDGYLLSLGFYNGTAKADVTFLTKNKWEVIGNEAKVDNMFYSCCAEPYPIIKYDITVKRTQHCH